MKTILTVKGMHCESCKMLIEDACKDIKGIKSCKVDFKTGKLELEHEKPIDLNLIKKEIKSLGDYEVK